MSRVLILASIAFNINVLSSWNVISKTGGFSKSAGLQAAIDYVTVSTLFVFVLAVRITCVGYKFPRYCYSVIPLRTLIAS